MPRMFSNRVCIAVLILFFTLGGGRNDGIAGIFFSYALLIWATWKGECIQASVRGRGLK